MHLAALREIGGAVGGRTHQRVTEPHPRAELDEPGRLGGRERVDGDTQRRGSPQEQSGVPHRLGGRDQQQLPSVSRKRPDTRHKTVLEPIARPCDVKTREPAGQFFGSEVSRHLEQAQRNPPGLRDDPIAHPVVEPTHDHRVQEFECVAVGQTVDV